MTLIAEKISSMLDRRIARINTILIGMIVTVKNPGPC